MIKIQELIEKAIQCVRFIVFRESMLDNHPLADQLCFYIAFQKSTVKYRKNATPKNNFNLYYQHYTYVFRYEI